MKDAACIPVEALSAAPPCAEETGNVLPLLHEIRHALERLARDDEPHVIDLRGLPMAPGEEQRIEAALGRGEVHATLDALGSSHIHETAFSGVWLITHCNEAGEVVGKFIEITRFPAILQSQDADLQSALTTLAERLGPQDEGAGVRA